ncbi:MAG TPA: helix-turn-helix domain-containing protein [Marmoricola sp.]|nr:helix-turn-helix domain-containing protein [Marmoricola sp.]
MDGLGEQLAGVGVLAEPARRTLYQYVLGEPSPVSREQAADAVGIPAHSVKFHLDKLVAAGLLEVEYRRLTGRTGPGAGRPAKLYRRSDREVALSVPPRRYDLAGEVLAEAVDRAVREAVPVDEAVRRVAGEVGRQLAVEAPDDSDGAEDEVERVSEVLGRHGYEPRVVEEELCLANCPFDRLATDHTELVCGLNLALVEGVLDGLQVETLQARLAPQPGFCCVKVAG